MFHRKSNCHTKRNKTYEMQKEKVNMQKGKMTKYDLLNATFADNKKDNW